MTDKWDLTSSIGELIRDPLTLQLMYDARNEGKLVSFLGQYFQAAKNIEKSIVEPFIVIQDPKEIELLKRGIFAGIMHEYPIDSTIQGTISSEKIYFRKKYIPQTNRFPNVFTINEGFTSFNGVVNPANGHYEGDWAFEFQDVPCDLETSGRFSMRRVFDMNKIIDALENIITDERCLTIK